MASLYFAGIDTTGHLIAFVVYVLAEHPEVRQEVEQEIDQLFASPAAISEEGLRGMVKLECVMNECLRIWPPAIGVLMR